MGRKQGVLHRIRIAWHLAINDLDYDIRSMTCGRCESMNIVEIEKPQEQTIPVSGRTTYIWRDKVKCKKCGSECEEKQTWRW